MKKVTRTISGVSPVAVMAHPAACPGACVYCPTYAQVPQSYTPESPAALRAISCDYDPARQVGLRLKNLAQMGHATSKVELIVMGGTFLALPLDYQYQFIKSCYDALNGNVSASLLEAQRRNEVGEHRAVGLCIETRPDFCGPQEIARMLDFGTTRVELGVQMLDDNIYRLVRRGHGVQAVVEATKLLRESGLKVHYHWMPGLPGSTVDNDLRLSQMLFSDSRFRPDGLKLYPTLVVKGSELEEWYSQGIYTPYSYEDMVDLIVTIKALVPRYVRISRVMRDIPRHFIVGGITESLRGRVQEVMAQRGLQCSCVRCREYGHRRRNGWVVGRPELRRLDYEASGGREIFLSYEDDNGTLFGLARLRIQDNPSSGQALKALLRELHVYGVEVPLGKNDAISAQHHGLGKGLLGAAEDIARNEFGSAQLGILSGVGARDYYRRVGYTQQGFYMVKDL